jgi:RNA-binding protein YhbY
LNIVGDDGENVAQSTSALLNEAKAIKLNVNDDKIKFMKVLPENDQVENVVILGHTFVKVRIFTYLRASICGNNDHKI